MAVDGNNPDNKQKADGKEDDDDLDKKDPDKNVDDPSIAKLVAEQVAEQLKDIKGKLDKAYSQRDDANRKLAEHEAKEKEAKLKQMEENGQKIEALELRLSEANAKIAVLEQQNTELTRDVSVRAAMTNLPFKNDRATQIAYKEIVDGLIKNDKGIWVHKSGISIKEFVEAFAKDEDQSFLFKVKASSGGGSDDPAPSKKSSNETKSLFAMSQDEVLKLAREGKLKKR